MNAQENIIIANSSRYPSEIKGLRLIRVNIGHVRVSHKPLVFDTVLGSCISVCLYDARLRIGGINHFMLPEGVDLNNPVSPRYGVHAMELLINKIMKLGGKRSTLEAKVFGGGHVIQKSKLRGSVPSMNIQFIDKFMETERLKVIKRDVGGSQPRRVLFCPHTGQVFVRLLGDADATETANEEKNYLQKLGVDTQDGESVIFKKK